MGTYHFTLYTHIHISAFSHRLCLTTGSAAQNLTDQLNQLIA
uniref:Uncharacterized protein n=1 Tax=Anguilla anguilla TaxID=7936 RepID=A0A0E9U8A4_ANGAN